MKTADVVSTRSLFINLLAIIFLARFSYSTSTETTHQYEITIPEINSGPININATNYTFASIFEKNDNDSIKILQPDEDITSGVTITPTVFTEPENTSVHVHTNETPSEIPGEELVRSYYANINENPENYEKELSLAGFNPKDLVMSDKVHYHNHRRTRRQAAPAPPWTWWPIEEQRSFDDSSSDDCDTDYSSSESEDSDYSDSGAFRKSGKGHNFRRNNMPKGQNLASRRSKTGTGPSLRRNMPKERKSTDLNKNKAISDHGLRRNMPKERKSDDSNKNKTISDHDLRRNMPKELKSVDTNKNKAIKDLDLRRHMPKELKSVDLNKNKAIRDLDLRRHMPKKSAIGRKHKRASVSRSNQRKFKK